MTKFVSPDGDVHVELKPRALEPPMQVSRSVELTAFIWGCVVSQASSRLNRASVRVVTPPMTQAVTRMLPSNARTASTWCSASVGRPVSANVPGLTEVLVGSLTSALRSAQSAGRAKW